MQYACKLDRALRCGGEGAADGLFIALSERRLGWVPVNERLESLIRALGHKILALEYGVQCVYVSVQATELREGRVILPTILASRRKDLETAYRFSSKYEVRIMNYLTNVVD